MITWMNKAAAAVLGISVTAGALFGTPLHVAAEDVSAPAYTYHFADAEEGRELLLSNEEYISSFNQSDLNFRLQKTDATVEEWKELAKDQIIDWTDEEKKAIETGMTEIQEICRKNNYHLPPSDEIIFIRDLMGEEGGAAGYTHGTQIYLEEMVPELLGSTEKEVHQMGLSILAHELFHCLTRSNPEFREDMYSIIHFTVQDEDFEFSPEIRERMINNPDVEHHNSYASFRIGGEDKLCTVVYYASRPFGEEGDNFFDVGRTGLVPIDDLSVLYDSDEAENFWNVFGINTEYVIDPEETMADNFSYVLTYGTEGKYKTPEIIDSIIRYLQGDAAENAA